MNLLRSPPGLNEPTLPAQMGQYRLITCLGRGGMGAVYSAQHVSLKKIVAIKILPFDRMHDPHSVLRFQREMEAVGKLNHPHLIQAFDAGEIDGRHFLVMEYLEGTDLGRLVVRFGPWPIAEACEAIRQAADGLGYVHGKGLVHRDLKPANLFLTSSGQIKILDMGLARLFDESFQEEHMTADGQLMGTADFMAPEQAFAAHSVDIRADLYSLGCTLFKLTTGRAPFAGPEYDTSWKKVLAHRESPIPSVTSLRPDFPEKLVPILERLLAKDPAQRFQHPAELNAALQEFTAGNDLVHRAETWCQQMSADANPDLSRSGAETRSNPAGHTPSVAACEENVRLVEAEVDRPARSRRRLLVIAVAACLAVAVAAIFWPWYRNEAVIVPPAPPPTVDLEPTKKLSEFAPDILPPVVWHDLLKYRPAELYWQNNNRLAFRGHDPNLQQLVVNSPGTSLFGLGRAAPGQAYEFQVKISQNEWTGGFGIFFGYHEIPNSNPKEATFQVLDMRRDHLNHKSFSLYRSRLTIGWNRQGIPGLGGNESLANASVSSPTLSEESLVIQVGPRTLQRVTWAGKNIWDLATAKANSRFREDEYQGQLGLYVANGSCTFSKCQLLLSKQLDKE